MNIIVTIEHGDDKIHTFGIEDAELLPIVNLLKLLTEMKRVVISRILQYTGDY